MKIPKKKKSICIIGGGFYGCYIAKKIKENFKNIKIEIYEKNTDLIVSEILLLTFCVRIKEF